jgi:hypothetical protein
MKCAIDWRRTLSYDTCFRTVAKEFARMRHVTEAEMTLPGEYQTIFDSCVETLQSISPGATYPEFTLEYANSRSGKMRAVSSQFGNGWYVFVSEVAVAQVEDGCLVHILVGVDAVSLWDFGWSRRVLKRFVERMTAPV